MHLHCVGSEGGSLKGDILHVYAIAGLDIRMSTNHRHLPVWLVQFSSPRNYLLLFTFQFVKKIPERKLTVSI